MTRCASRWAAAATLVESVRMYVMRPTVPSLPMLKPS